MIYQKLQTMKNTKKITTEQLYNIERKARRDADIANNIPYFKHKTHPPIKHK